MLQQFSRDGRGRSWHVVSAYFLALLLSPQLISICQHSTPGHVAQIDLSQLIQASSGMPLLTAKPQALFNFTSFLFVCLFGVCFRTKYPFSVFVLGSNPERIPYCPQCWVSLVSSNLLQFLRFPFPFMIFIFYEQWSAILQEFS